MSLKVGEKSGEGKALCVNCRVSRPLVDSDRCVDCESWTFGDPITRRGQPMSFDEHAFKRAIIAFVSSQAHTPTVKQLSQGTGLSEDETTDLAHRLARKGHAQIDYDVMPMRIIPIFYETDMRVRGVVS